jgi:hypothetical protein
MINANSTISTASRTARSSQKMVCAHILNKLGLRHDFNTLCNNIGLLHFVFQEAATYHNLKLEFLTTLNHTVGRYHTPGEDQPGVNRISFCLMNRECELTPDEWCHYFGFNNNTSIKRFACFTLNLPPLNYFSRMKLFDTLPQGNNIEFPAIRNLYYVIVGGMPERQ